MRFSIEKLPKSQIELKIQLSPEEFEEFLEKAKEIARKEVEVPGFRKGEAPKELVVKKIGEEKILKEGATLAIKETYLKIIKEQNLEIIGQPEVEILKLAPQNPFEFKIKASFLPEVILPDYKKIASTVKKKEVEVTKEDIERLKKEKERIEKERVREEILEKIANNTQIDIPDILIERERERMLENFKKEIKGLLGMEFDQYLEKTGQKIEDILKELTLEAQRRIKNSLILREIEKREKITVTDEEIEKEREKFLKLSPEFRMLDLNSQKEYAKEIVLNQKVLEFLENFVEKS